MAGALLQIQVMSDLRLENPMTYDTYETKPKAAFLALLGDTDHTIDIGLFDFLRKQLESFQKVFCLLGNHEPYHNSWTKAKATVRALKAAITK